MKTNKGFNRHNLFKTISIAIVAILFANSCGTVAVTGRKQLMLVSDEDVLSLSNKSYKEYMDTAKVSTDKKNTEMVVRVGTRLANAVEEYLKANGLESECKNFAWEFHLVQDKEANAFCMPGGKIVVNEGLLPITQTESALAVVLGHEIAHAVAKHSAERMSHQILTNYGASALGVILSGQSAATQAVSQAVYGLGANYGVMMPFSRKDESEADHMGLIFAAMAGYDPQVAVPFWQRMQAAGTKVPEFFSDHPSDANRIAQIQKELPEAMKYYNAYKASAGKTKPSQAKPATAKKSSNKK
ncbi:MAG: M48 family metallopeptidase [Bacteroidales bacterium]|jgi:predicted Zn-dependent protease|nr:M48 family metallopeptidase [Bacteroidales bacterium]